MMKNISKLLAVFVVCVACNKYDDSAIKTDISNLQSRVNSLELRCGVLNDNITSLQALVSAIQNRDCIVGLSDLPDGTGYSLTFSSGRTIVLHNGKDGENGKDGINGTDGYTPQISIALFSDGNYYWQIDGERIKVDGKMVRATGIDGKDGADGKNGNDGIDGKDGANGKDGIDGKDGKDGNDGKDATIPRLKIEDDFWYITYDEGKVWIKLGKAVGGNGKDGKDGNNYFESVTVENGYVVVVINDAEKTTLKIPMALNNSVATLRYIPEYSDGVARVPYYKNGSTVVSLPFYMKFEIVPESLSEYIEKNWQKDFSAKAIYTKIVTKASTGEYVPLKIMELQISNGVITVKVSPTNLDEAFFAEKLAASFCLRMNGGNQEAISDYITLKPELGEPEDPNPDYGGAVVSYTTIDGAVFPFSISGYYNGAVNKCNNVYNDGEGKIYFDDDIDRLSFFIPKERRSEITSFKILAEVSIYGNLMERFSGCTRLKDVDLSKIETSGVQDMNFMFNECSSLKTLELSNWNLGKTTKICGMFNDCSSLKSVEISGWNTTNVTDMHSIFSGCTSLKDIDISKWNTGKVTDMRYMFDGCSSLENLDISDWNTSNVVKMRSLFNNAKSLKSLDLSKWNTQSVTDMYSLFSGCVGLKTLDLSGWDTRNVINMHSMFYDCSELEVLDISGWDTSDVVDHQYMFGGWKGCLKLKTIYMRGCNEATIAMIESEKPRTAVIITE